MTIAILQEQIDELRDRIRILEGRTSKLDSDTGYPIRLGGK